MPQYFIKFSSHPYKCTVTPICWVNYPFYPCYKLK
jgi:hypothetical protein